MEDKGWIKLHRCLLDKPIWSCSTLEQKVILITILMLANHRAKEWEWQGKKFMCNPGQFITSSTNLAKAAGVSRQNIRSALVKFKKYEFLTCQSTKTGILVTLTNWEKYQARADELTNGLTNNQPRANQRLTTNKNNKELKNDKKYIDDLFNQFWKEYPKKQAKQDAVRAWGKIKPDESLFAVIMDGLGRAKKSKQWAEGFVLNPATFLNGRRWEDIYNDATLDTRTAAQKALDKMM